MAHLRLHSFLPHRHVRPLLPPRTLARWNQSPSATLALTSLRSATLALVSDPIALRSTPSPTALALLSAPSALLAAALALQRRQRQHQSYASHHEDLRCRFPERLARMQKSLIEKSLRESMHVAVVGVAPRLADGGRAVKNHMELSSFSSWLPGVLTSTFEELSDNGQLLAGGRRNRRTPRAVAHP